MQEQIRVILEAEAEARQRLDAANRDCKILQAKAEEEGRARVEEARQASDGIARAVEEQLVTASQEEARRIAAACEEAVAAMQGHAQGRLSEAVQAVLSAMLGRGG